MSALGVPAGPLVLVLMVGAAMVEEKQSSPRDPATVVFVCQHGNVKSLIASQWFNRLAAERGLSVRSVSRGVEPETPVPAAIVDRLSRDGFDVRAFEPKSVAPADVDGAAKVVMIGLEPPDWMKGSKVPVDKWDGIPPASEQYEASRDAMRERIEVLLKSSIVPGRDP